MKNLDEAGPQVGRRMTATESAYLAGVLDGEGCICIVARKMREAAKPRYRRSHQFGVEITIGNTSYPLMEWLVETTRMGRILTSPQQRYANQKAVYTWRPSRTEQRFLLPQILDYMVIKRRQAEIVLAYYAMLERGPGGRMADEDLPKFLQLYAEIRVLNRTGLAEATTVDFELAPKQLRPVRACQQQDCEVRCYRAEDFCYQHWLLVRERIVKQCEHCGREMECIHARKRFCSPKCMWEADYKRRLNNPCAVPGCPRALYWKQPWCYLHWKEQRATEAGAERESV